MPAIGTVEELRVGAHRLPLTDTEPTYSVQNLQAANVRGLDGTMITTFTRLIQFIEAEVLSDGSWDVPTVTGYTDTTVILTRSDRVVTLRNARCVSDGTANAANGRMTLRYEGEEGREVSA